MKPEKVEIVQVGCSLRYRIKRVEKPVGKTIRTMQSREELKAWAVKNGYEVVG